MSWFLASTVGKVVVFYVDIVCGLLGKALEFDGGEDD